MQIFTINKENSKQTLIKYLNRILKEAPSSLLYKQLRNKNITLNGKKAQGKEMLSEGDVINVFMSDETIAKFSGKSKDNTSGEEYLVILKKFGKPEIIYEDDHIMILNKPVGVLSQKASQGDISVNEWLIGYLIDRGSLKSDDLLKFKPGVCNRLDRNTGGLILFAKSVYGANILNEAIRSKNLDKYYITLAEGNFTKEGIVNSYISKDERTNKVTVSDSEKPGYDLISAEFKPLQYYSEKDITLIEVKLITGRSHQIRAQLSHLKHPVIGDNKYGSTRKYRHHFLYAVRVIFPLIPDYPEISGKTFSIDYNDLISEYI